MNPDSSSTRFLFHPILVHFPIAFFVLECLLLCLWIWKKEDFFRRSSYLVFRIGYFAMLITMAAGYFDANGINSMVRKHFISACITALFYTGHGILWIVMKKADHYQPFPLAGTAMIGCLLLGATGYLGGLLVYS